MSIEKEEIVFNRSYYNTNDFYNTYLSSIIAINSYLETLLFPNDPKRIVYSTNDHAFRRRLKVQATKDPDVSQFQINSLNMPFMNFAISSGGIGNSTDRILKNSQLERLGVMDWVSNKKIKLSPLKLEFEATYFSTEEIDIQYAISQIQWQSALETTLKPQIQIDDNIYFSYGNVKFSSVDYNPRYNENDWLQQNKIRTIGLSLSLDTYLIMTDTSKFWIPKTVLLSFATSKDLEVHDWDNYDELLTGVIDYVNEEITFS